jgi:hypothetical protein
MKASNGRTGIDCRRILQMATMSSAVVIVPRLTSGDNARSRIAYTELQREKSA